MFEGYVEEPICKRHISLVKRPNYQDRSVSELILDFGPGVLDFCWGREQNTDGIEGNYSVQRRRKRREIFDRLRRIMEKEREQNVLSFFKGILHQKIFYCLNLIFWIVMECGIARFGRKGLKTTET